MLDTNVGLIADDIDAVFLAKFSNNAAGFLIFSTAYPAALA